VARCLIAFESANRPCCLLSANRADQAVRAQVVETLQAAMNIAYTNQVAYHQVDEPDEAIVLYNNELRGAIVQAAEGALCRQYALCSVMVCASVAVVYSNKVRGVAIHHSAAIGQAAEGARGLRACCAVRCKLPARFQVWKLAPTACACCCRLMVCCRVV
jgi:hypothetical protein